MIAVENIMQLPPLDARIPKWSLDSLESRSCPICRVDNAGMLLRPDGLPVAFCRECALWYVAQLPPIEEVHKLYQGYWFYFRPKNLSDSYAKIIRSGLPPRDDIRLNRLSALTGGLDGKRLLEIGCGCGEFLSSARSLGASVFGNDISAEACSFVRDKLQIPVFQGALSDVTFKNAFGEMDIVVMSDLIEHPTEPLELFRSALDILRPDGLLLIHTPNGGGAGEDMSSAKEWVGFRVDLEHLQYFSAETMAVLAGKFGCRIEHLETFGYPGLDGIDRHPVLTGPSLKDRLRTHLKKSGLARTTVARLRTVRNAFAPRPRDPRCGTYHLLTILRKRNWQSA